MTLTGSATPCIPGRKMRKKAVKYDKRRYKHRNRIEIMFGRVTDWRRVATRYDRRPKTSFSAVTLAVTIIFWLGSMTTNLGAVGGHSRLFHGLPIASSVAQSIQPTARHHRLFASIVVRNSSRERTVSLMVTIRASSRRCARPLVGFRA